MLFILFLLSGHFRLRNGMKWLYWVMEIFPQESLFKIFPRRLSVSVEKAKACICMQSDTAIRVMFPVLPFVVP